jgi:hypothetical protein
MKLKKNASSLAFSVAIVCCGAANAAQSGPVEADQTSGYLNMDEELALIADAVPGFAGYRLDKAGNTKIMMAPSAKRDAKAMGSLEEMFGKKIQIETAAYDYRTLLTWKSEIEKMFGDKSGLFQMVDIDENNNRIVIGVDTKDSRNRLMRAKALIKALNIPSSALRFERNEPATSLAFLDDSQRPAAGGMQISLRTPTGQSYCTLGVPVKRNGIVGFVTAQHCKEDINPAVGVAVYQPEPNKIGTIAALGSFVNSGCSSGDKCLYSDAMYVKADNASSISLGKTNYTQGYQNLTIAGQHRITAVASFPSSDKRMMSTGRTTGTSINGGITKTCVTLALEVGTVFCTNSYAITGQSPKGGDSGSPVYYRNTDGTVTLSGILIAIGSGEATYTPWTQVQKQLGTLSLF